MKNYLFFCFLPFILPTASSQINKQTAVANELLCGPIASVCNPSSVNTGGIMGVGITYFSLGQISNTSTNNSTVGYQDFTCSDSSYLIQGDSYPIEITTGQTYAEVIRVWIDYNNDGNFDSTELIFGDLPTVYTHYGIATIPVTGQLGVPLRMRVGSEVDLYPPPDGCTDVQYGQYEDYTIYLNGPTWVANFFNGKPTVSLSPNPFHTTAKLEIKNWKLEIKNGELKIYSSMGVPVRRIILSIAGGEAKIDRGNLVDGLYFYELRTTSSELIGTGKFVVE